jgi:DNA repair exonuclease SbcCD nuclease subunit
MDELRVLHAADLHIDSPMHGLVAYEGAPLDEIRAATRTALRALVAEAIDRKIHLLLLAGDLYDGSWRDYSTGLFVVSQLAELHEAGIPVVIVYGNHDAESQLTKRLRLPPNTTVLSSAKPETCVLSELGVAVHGQSYATRAVSADLSLTYPSADPGMLNIGMLHTCFDGSLGHDPYAPCTLPGLRSKGYDYWALGHVHNHTIVCEDPMTVFPGNLQGRQVRETGPKGASLATFVDHEPRLEQLSFDLVRWDRCRVDLTGTGSLDECLARCREELLRVISTGATTYAIRVDLHGPTTANSLLRSKFEQVTNEVRALALAIGGAPVWIERVVVATTPPTGHPTLEGDGVAGEIGRVLAELKGDVSKLAARDGSLIPALSALRSQLRAAGGADLGDALDDADITAALDDAAELLATLLGAEGTEHAN